MDSTKRPSPVYLLAGGRGSIRGERDPVLTSVIAGSGVRAPSIAYIGAASGDDRSFFKMIAGFLRVCGAGEVRLVELASKRARLDKARRVLEESEMVFVSGGDVEEGMEVLTERGALPLLRELFDRGKPFVGLSAGSIMLAREWIAWEDPNDDSTASTFPCMAFAPLVCDTHGEGEDWDELRALLLISPAGTIGYGIPMGGGLRADLEGGIEALGRSATRFEKATGAVRRLDDLAPR
jgi:peptidase E